MSRASGQYGMNMPGGQAQRAPQMNVYTALLLLAVFALLAASGFLYVNGAKVAPNGTPYSVHKYNEGTKSYEINLKD